MIECELEPQQQLLLWRLMVSDGGGMFLKHLELTFDKTSRRTDLVRHGLTDESKRRCDETNRTPIWIQLTEKGWCWCQDHLETPLNSRSPMVVPVFNALRQLLAAYFRQQDNCSSIAEMILISQKSVDHQTELNPECQLRQAIEKVCLDVAGGRENVRVRLADLRPQLSEFSREEVDEELRSLERTGRLSIWQLNDPMEITAADKEAALITAGGNQSHIVYYGGPS